MVVEAWGRQAPYASLSFRRVIDVQRFSHFDRAMMRILHSVNIKVVALFKGFEPKMLMDWPTTSQPGD